MKEYIKQLIHEQLNDGGPTDEIVALMQKLKIPSEQTRWVRLDVLLIQHTENPEDQAHMVMEMKNKVKLLIQKNNPMTSLSSTEEFDEMVDTMTALSIMLDNLISDDFRILTYN